MPTRVAAPLVELLEEGRVLPLELAPRLDADADGVDDDDEADQKIEPPQARQILHLEASKTIMLVVSRKCV